MVPKKPRGPEQAALGRAIDERRIKSSHSLHPTYRRLQHMKSALAPAGSMLPNLQSPDPLIPYPFFPFNACSPNPARGQHVYHRLNIELALS